MSVMNKENELFEALLAVAQTTITDIDAKSKNLKLKPGTVLVNVILIILKLLIDAISHDSIGLLLDLRQSLIQAVQRIDSIDLPENTPERMKAYELRRKEQMNGL
jgi:hypothetical protein